MKTFATLSTLVAVAVALPWGQKRAESVQPGSPGLGTGLSALPSFTGAAPSVPFSTGSGATPPLATGSFPTGGHHHHHAHGTGVPGAAAPTGLIPTGTAPAYSDVTAAPTVKARSPAFDPFDSDIVPGSAFSLPGGASSGFALPTGAHPSGRKPGAGSASPSGVFKPGSGSDAGSSDGAVSIPSETASGFASQGTGLSGKEKKQHAKRSISPSFTGLPLVPTGFTGLPSGGLTGLPSPTGGDFSFTGLPPGGLPKPSGTGSELSFTALPTAVASSK